ncbi:hypothetical protein P152DRAFT_516663 [Eremomyces bilateralis CBS 781.70]|uniref:Uncharacterized protein n=1 Tax=Eremomyces bilateralis CBS 781.70 TaxID=1392243 RepID=A0A6G1FUV7_9PEZI|nr:uncharacterized protein P152DRAFT_516663 [Eremomyces bilateralis CBS 781.70]KAF1809486.1 hypothetical protein P152DRAFT_516663 [Eremomyces bilateralis CBS 781.70]
MSGIKDMVKGGWHPGTKEGSQKQSWRGDFKGVNQVAGLLGKGQDNSSNVNAQARAERQSAPVSSLQDPDTWGPPPRRKDTGDIASSSGSTPVARPQQAVPQPSSPEQEAVEEESHQPYRADTTGLGTANLPKPPVRRVGATPPSRPARTDATRPKPNLPPRLPPRQNTSSASTTPLSPPPAYESLQRQREDGLNQSSLNSLGRAGINIPELGISSSSKPTPTLPSPLSTGSPAQSPRSHTLSGLGSRFSSLKTHDTSDPSDSPATPKPTLTSTSSAFKTATALRNNPSSVSASDARDAATTVHGIQQRHGSQIASGWRKAGEVNERYGVMDRVGRVGAPETTQSGGSLALAAGKKAPPPPPKKKMGIGEVDSGGGGGPPPVPTGSKPRFS